MATTRKQPITCVVSTIKNSQFFQTHIQPDGEGWLLSGDLSPEQHVLVIYNLQEEPIAAVVVVPAVGSRFQRLTNLDDDALNFTAYIDSVWVAKDAVVKRALPLIAYFAFRQARIEGFDNVALLMPKTSAVPLPTLWYFEPLSNLPAVTDQGQTYIPMAQRIKYATTELYESFEAEERSMLPHFFVEEILTTYKLWLKKFFQGSWAQAIINERISKEQYICSLYNLYQYVKFTTRLCARCIAHSDDLRIRNHYIYHLKGEVNHELFIERDLQHLGVEVDYLQSQHVPLEETNEFIAIQESTIGFKQDPVLMLACPLVAEGISAHLDKNFIEHLYCAIRSWGVEAPEEAAKFLSSHVQFDGGGDGHWQLVVDLLQHYMTDEVRLQNFLCVLRTAMNGMARSFNATIDKLKLWQVPVQQHDSANI